MVEAEALAPAPLELVTPPTASAACSASSARARSSAGSGSAGSSASSAGKSPWCSSSEGASPAKRSSGAYRASGHGCSAGVIAGEGASMQRDHAWHSARFLEDLDGPAEIGRKAAQRAVSRLSPTRPKPGKYPVIFDPRVSSTLLGHLSGAIAGAAIARKTSFLQDKLGSPVFGKGVTVVDDPLRPRGLRSRPFDGEGVRVARRELISAGRLNGWMAESASARQLGIEPTGHASRGVGGAPGAAPSNLYMEAGPRNREDLLAAFPEAVLIIELIGQGVNPVTGDYSRGAVGFMVRGGEIAEPVAEITIASNLIDMFATLEPASDLEFRRGVDAPTLLVPEMTVGAA